MASMHQGGNATPNTLAHFGIQAILTRGILRKAPPEWIFLGCVVPDVPWILQRVLRAIGGIDPYDLRLYAIAQSSLIVSLLLCGALSLLSGAPSRAFKILALGSVLHLLLDALQTKFANGVHLFAPVSWQLLNLAGFWPESATTYVLTGLGVAAVAYAWAQTPSEEIAPPLRRSALLLSVALLLAYLVAPLPLLGGPLAADNHSVRTLRNLDARPGSRVEFDRNHYAGAPSGDVLVTWAGEELRVQRPSRGFSGTVSVRAQFVSPHEIRILELHRHARWLRDIASYLGLAALAALWLRRALRIGKAR